MVMASFSFRRNHVGRMLFQRTEDRGQRTEDRRQEFGARFARPVSKKMPVAPPTACFLSSAFCLLKAEPLRVPPYGASNEKNGFNAGPFCSSIRSYFSNEKRIVTMQELNPIINQIYDLKRRCQALRGYL